MLILLLYWRNKDENNSCYTNRDYAIRMRCASPALFPAALHPDTSPSQTLEATIMRRTAWMEVRDYSGDGHLLPLSDDDTRELRFTPPDKWEIDKFIEVTVITGDNHEMV